MNEYDRCLKEASKNHTKGNLKLCPRGYCTAKQKFEVYPSAYANGYAVSVCKGDRPDVLGQFKNSYVGKNRPNNSSLARWYEEKWVNVCERDSNGYAACGSGDGVGNPESYPYCRPSRKLRGTIVKSVDELTEDEIAKMCRAKRSQKQGINGKPSRVYVDKQLGGSPRLDMVKIPDDVRKAARLGLKLRLAGFEGGTQTGWDRAEQLSGRMIDLDSLADMRTWFARHGPDASNGGTSYPGYLRWIEDGRPMSGNYSGYRGAVSWLIWGGDAAYLWLKSKDIRELLESAYPDRKSGSIKNNLKRL